MLKIARHISPVEAREYKWFFRDSRVRILGLMSRGELGRRMASADVFVFPPLSKRSARVVFETLACGCYARTTLTSRAIVPAGDATALAMSIKPVALIDRAKLRVIGVSNAQVVRPEYIQRHYSDQMLERCNWRARTSRTTTVTNAQDARRDGN